jgi:hypothetical protein
VLVLPKLKVNNTSCSWKTSFVYYRKKTTEGKGQGKKSKVGNGF